MGPSGSWGMGEFMEICGGMMGKKGLHGYTGGQEWPERLHKDKNDLHDHTGETCMATQRPSMATQARPGPSVSTCH